MRALLAEDDRMIGEAVVNALKDASYAVDWVRDGDAASEALAVHIYDVILLDLGLPNRDGLAVLRCCRSKGDAAPVVIITARDAVDDRIVGLDAGADDYVIKPFDMGELLARMRAVIRRKAGSAQALLTNGRISLDPATREATCEGAPYRAGILASAGPHDEARRDPVARRTRGSDLWLGRGGREQRGRVPDSCVEAQTRRGCDPKRERRRMAGRKGRLSRSLEFRLFLWLSLAILVIAGPAGALSYSHAFHEAIELQDDQLRQTAAWLKHQHFSAPLVAAQGPADADPESRLIVLTAQPRGPWQPQEAAPGLVAEAPDGLQTATIGGAPWRIVISTDEKGQRIAVGQQTALRNEVANTSAMRAVAPLLGLIILLPVVIGATLRRMLKPLKAVADDLKRRSDFNWKEIPEAQLPTEIRPFVAAIRRLLARVAASVAEQRRFLADAAHELRSPLTALSLQAERLED